MFTGLGLFLFDYAVAKFLVSSFKERNWGEVSGCIFMLFMMTGGLLPAFSFNNYLPQGFGWKMQVLGMIIPVAYYLISKAIKSIFHHTTDKKHSSEIVGSATL